MGKRKSVVPRDLRPRRVPIARPQRSAAVADSEETPVRAVQRAFDLLGCFGPQRSTLTLSEFARESDLPVTTVSRLLSTLEGARFVQRLPGGRYGCGAKLAKIGLTALQSLSVYEISDPHLRDLSERTGETANLGVLDENGRGVMYLRNVQSRRAIRHAAWLGLSVPLDGTAIGAAIQGRVGPQGYVATRKTIEPDLTAIAAPVRDASSAIVGALSVTGPSYRISDEQLARYGRWVAEAALRASRDLGGD